MLQRQQGPLSRQIEQLSDEREEAARQLAALRDDNERLNRNTSELLKLRGEIGALKQQLAERQAHLDNRATDAGQASNGAGLTLTPDALQDVGNNTPEAAIQTLLWAAARKNGGRLAELFDRDSLLSAAFVKLRQAKPNMSVSEAESLAKDFVDKMKQSLTTGAFTNRDLDSERSPSG